eukprot:g1914.t1
MLLPHLAMAIALGGGAPVKLHALDERDSVAAQHVTLNWKGYEACSNDLDLRRCYHVGVNSHPGLRPQAPCWKPWAFPAKAALVQQPRTSRAKCMPPVSAFTGYLPVSRVIAMGNDPSVDTDLAEGKLYFFAAGCSDMYVKVRETDVVVGNNACGALVELAKKKLSTKNEFKAGKLAVKLLGEQGKARLCGKDMFTALMINYYGNMCTKGNATALEQCIYTDVSMKPTCQWASHKLMQELKLTTAVLRYERPAHNSMEEWQASPPKHYEGHKLVQAPWIWADQRRFWKTEVIRAVPYADETFYDAQFRPCKYQVDSSSKDGQQIYCNDSPALKESLGAIEGPPRARRGMRQKGA